MSLNIKMKSKACLAVFGRIECFLLEEKELLLLKFYVWIKRKSQTSEIELY